MRPSVVLAAVALVTALWLVGAIVLGISKVISGRLTMLLTAGGLFSLSVLIAVGVGSGRLSFYTYRLKRRD